jgi:hypothetical protein
MSRMMCVLESVWRLGLWSLHNREEAAEGDWPETCINMNVGKSSFEGIE